MGKYIIRRGQEVVKEFFCGGSMALVIGEKPICHAGNSFSTKPCIWQQKDASMAWMAGRQ
jgi:hypothetical protein